MYKILLVDDEPLMLKLLELYLILDLTVLV